MEKNVPESARRGSLLVIFLTVFIDLLGFGMVLPLLPIYADQFVLTESGWQLGLLMASFSAMQFLFAPVWGRISDSVGRRPVLIIGLAGSAVFYTLFGIATVYQSLTMLFVSRIGAGISGATISTAQAYIADSTSLENRPKGMALIGMAFGLGFTFGPLLGFLAVPDANAVPGPGPGYAAAVLSSVALVLAIVILPESNPRVVRRKEAEREETVGTAGTEGTQGTSENPYESSEREGKRADPSAYARTHQALFSGEALRTAISVPSIGLLLLTLFVCVFSFANFETTLSLLIKQSGEKAIVTSPFGFSWGQVCLTYAFIGFTLALVQGGLVRRLAGRLSEVVMAAGGALLEVTGFLTMIGAIYQGSIALLLAALAIVVAGFAFMQPSLNSLISRRSDPEKQGVVLGLGQSTSSLARILGSGIGIPLLTIQLTTPYYVAVGLMILGGILVLIAARRGQDY